MATALMKTEFIFFSRMSQPCKSVQSKNFLRLNMHQQRYILKEDTKNLPLRFAFSKIHRTYM